MTREANDPQRLVVFLCYRQTDGSDAARWLHRQLNGLDLVLHDGRAVKLETYFDQDTAPDSSWPEVHQSYLEVAKAMIVVCSGALRANLSAEGRPDWAHYELDWWVDHHDAAPILIDLTGDERLVPQPVRDRWPDAQRLRLGDLAEISAVETGELVERIAKGIRGSSAQAALEERRELEHLNSSLRARTRSFQIAAAVSSLLLVCTLIFFVRANRNEVAAREAEEVSKDKSYASTVLAAQQLIESGETQGGLDLLESTAEGRRGWEYGRAAVLARGRLAAPLFQVPAEELDLGAVCLAQHPDHGLFAGTRQGFVVRVDSMSGAPLGRWDTGSTISGMAFIGPDDDWLMTCHMTGECFLWDPATEQRLDRVDVTAGSSGWCEQLVVLGSTPPAALVQFVRAGGNGQVGFERSFAPSDIDVLRFHDFSTIPRLLRIEISEVGTPQFLPLDPHLATSLNIVLAAACAQGSGEVWLCTERVDLEKKANGLAAPESKVSMGSLDLESMVLRGAVLGDLRPTCMVAWEAAQGMILGTETGDLLLVGNQGAGPRDNLWSGSGKIVALAISPDERFLAVGTEQGALSVLRTMDWSLLTTVRLGAEPIDAAAFGERGRTVFASSRDSGLGAWLLPETNTVTPLPRPVRATGVGPEPSPTPRGLLALRFGRNNPTGEALRLWQDGWSHRLFALVGVPWTQSPAHDARGGTLLPETELERLWVECWDGRSFEPLWRSEPLGRSEGVGGGVLPHQAVAADDEEGGLRLLLPDGTSVLFDPGTGAVLERRPLGPDPGSLSALAPEGSWVAWARGDLPGALSWRRVHGSGEGSLQFEEPVVGMAFPDEGDELFVATADSHLHRVRLHEGLRTDLGAFADGPSTAATMDIGGVHARALIASESGCTLFDLSESTVLWCQPRRPGPSVAMLDRSGERALLGSSTGYKVLTVEGDTVFSEHVAPAALTCATWSSVDGSLVVGRRDGLVQVLHASDDSAEAGTRLTAHVQELRRLALHLRDPEAIEALAESERMSATTFERLVASSEVSMPSVDPHELLRPAFRMSNSRFASDAAREGSLSSLRRLVISKAPGVYDEGEYLRSELQVSILAEHVMAWQLYRLDRLEESETLLTAICPVDEATLEGIDQLEGNVAPRDVLYLGLIRARAGRPAEAWKLFDGVIWNTSVWTDPELYALVEWCLDELQSVEPVVSAPLRFGCEVLRPCTNGADPTEFLDEIVAYNQTLEELHGLDSPGDATWPGGANAAFAELLLRSSLDLQGREELVSSLAMNPVVAKLDERLLERGHKHVLSRVGTTLTRKAEVGSEGRRPSDADPEDTSD